MQRRNCCNGRLEWCRKNHNSQDNRWSLASSFWQHPLHGKDISRTEAYALVRNGISYIPEGRRLFGKLTVRQNLELGAYTTKERSVIQKTSP